MNERLPVAARAAATVIFLRERPGGYAVLMVRRSARASFVPDMYVFPGGGVDAADGSPEAAARWFGLEHLAAEPAPAFAAVRESFEEAGLLLACDARGNPANPRAVDLAAARARLLRDPNLDFAALLASLDLYADARALVYFSRWITPEVEPIRYDAHFFLALAPPGQEAEADETETHDGLWIAPGDALERHRTGTFAMIFPTIKHLERLARFPTIDGLLAHARASDVVAVMPSRTLELPEELPDEARDLW